MRIRYLHILKISLPKMFINYKKKRVAKPGRRYLNQVFKVNIPTKKTYPRLASRP